MTGGKKSQKSPEKQNWGKVVMFLRVLVSIVISSIRACFSFTGTVLALSGLVYSKIKAFSLLFSSLGCLVPINCPKVEHTTKTGLRVNNWPQLSLRDRCSLNITLSLAPVAREHRAYTQLQLLHITCSPETASVAGVI